MVRPLSIPATSEATIPSLHRPVDVDATGNAYVVGVTQSSSSSFPGIVGPDLTYNGGGDGFIVKLTADGRSFDYAGYIGGDGLDMLTSVSVNGSGNAFVAGSTDSTETSFPVLTGPDLSYNGGSLDAFVAELSLDGSALLYAGYVGGAATDRATAISVNSSGNAVLAGWTDSTEASFPVALGPDLTYNGGGSDAFVAAVSDDGRALLSAGYIGGDELDQGLALAHDASGNVWLAGYTRSTEASFPVAGGPDLSYNGGFEDAFIAQLTDAASTLLTAGYIGGDDSDYGHGVATDAAGGVYVVGDTWSSETTFPVLVGPGLSLSGREDAFVVKLGSASCAVTASEIVGLLAVKGVALPDDVSLQWTADPAGAGHNVWYVNLKEEIPLARLTSSPPALPIPGCTTPAPAPGDSCDDTAGVSRDRPSVFFYQVRTYCDASTEGP